ncbi:MAG: hypothetical protein VX640_08800 [Pseudomonadota bacterium]|nr:hypothetical protein [Pseudomonadota bacterium]
MNLKALCKPAALAAGGLACAAGGAAAQTPDMAAMEKWASAAVIHYEATGVLSDKHVQIPAADADQYGDVVEKVTLSFDWDKNANAFVGAPKFVNHPATVSNLTGMDAGCPAGEMKGPYEHFDIVSMKSNGEGAIELTGVRKHPDTMVAESCGAGLKLYKAAEEPVSTWTGPPDPSMMAMGPYIPKDSPIRITPDGKSIIMTALNNNWVWTYTPSLK